MSAPAPPTRQAEQPIGLFINTSICKGTDNGSSTIASLLHIQPGKKDIQVVRALYTYTPQQPDELGFEEGDILVIEKENVDWWKCRSGTNEGMVPSNYVGENTAQIDNPLHEAAKRGNESFVAELLAAGVSVNGLDRAGNTPIHWACRGGHAQIVSYLLKQSPTINAQNKLGDTPLHLAAWGGHSQVVYLLLGHPDVRVNLRNNDGSTPLDLAKNAEIGAALLNFTGCNGADDLAGDGLDEEDEEVE
ncbi:hypothetical protein BDV3_004931 [Batrachochytrium dendrobatidis]